MERWLAVPGYEDLYEVSDHGRVRSLPRQTARGVRGGRILKHHISPSTHGYPVVSLSRDGVAVNRLVHRLVLQAFTGPCPPGMESLHGPGGKTDPSLPNLSWGTRSENTGRDRRRDGQDNRGERSGHAKLTWDAVADIRRQWDAAMNSPHHAWEGGILRERLGRQYGVTASNIWQICRRKTWITGQ